MRREDLHNISICMLLKTGSISVRTCNCCHHAELNSLYDIVSYYEQGNSFLIIKNAGRRTCEELENLCKNTNVIPLQNIDDVDENVSPLQNINNINENVSYKTITEGEKLYESLSFSQRLLTEQKYTEQLNSCSVRTKNGLSQISMDDFIKDYLLCQSKELFNIKNIGEKSINEILEFRENINTFIKELKEIQDYPLPIIRLRTKNIYAHICEDNFVADIYEKRCHLPMFWILEQYLKNDKSREIGILIGSFNIFKNQQMYTLDELAAKYDLTRERVRQIRNKIFHKTFEINDDIIEDTKNDLVKYNMLFQNKNDWSYLLNIFKETDIVCQESFEVQNYLKEEKCSFSAEFVLQIISNLFQERYYLLGGIDMSNKSKTWENTFLIKREYSDIFDFEKMRVEFSNIIMDNETDCLLDIEDYIANSQCWIKYDYNKTDSLISIIRDFLLYEFHLYSDDIDGRIKIPANKERKPIYVVYEILQQTGRPMHLNEIFEEFKIVLPKHKYTEAAQLRPYLQRHEAISYRNRNSVYTLKEWEHIRTGTIRDAIIEFLLQNDLPQNADDITEYVLQYFPETNISSVRSSMLIDTQKRFSFYKDNLLGLVIKDYPPEYEEIEQIETQRKSFSQRVFDLEKFIIENDHFPFSSSQDKNEESLYRWWRLIINGTTHITNDQKNVVDRVIIQYTGYETDKSTYEWNINYNKLKCFLLENRRIPYARGDEKFLYGWFRRTKEDFQNYNLTEEQRQKYIDLAKLI